MQSFSSLALKLSGQMEDNRRTCCKNAKFQTAPYGTKIVLMIFAKLPLSLAQKGLKIFFTMACSAVCTVIQYKKYYSFIYVK